MGTRADFYVGRGETAEWLGSIAWDGYPTEDKKPIFDATSEQEYREAVKKYLEEDDESTLPDEGWPWPWDDSSTTDYAYAFDQGRTWATNGRFWYEPEIELDDETWDQLEANSERPIFPNMLARKKVKLGRGSGIIIIGPNGPK